MWFALPLHLLWLLKMPRTKKENKKKIKANQEYQKAYRAKNKEAYQAYQKAYCAENKEKKNEKGRLEAEEFAKQNGEKVQSEKERDAAIDTLLDEPREELDGRNLRECIDNDENFLFYVGGTFRDLKEEDLRWLTSRGRVKFDNKGNIKPGQDMTKRNRPVLLHINGDSVTMKTARDQFGFRSFVVYEDLLHLNASRIEDKLQGRYQHLDLGKRLWRCQGKGPKYTKSTKRVHKVFVTFSFKVRKSLRKKILKLQF